MSFLSEWPPYAPKDQPYMMSTYPEDKARELFIAKHKIAPRLNFTCGDWRYVGPINTLDK